MTDKQPEALRLVDALTNPRRWHDMTDDDCEQAAAELRRLYEKNVQLRGQRDELLEALQEVSEVFDVSWREGSTQRRLGDLARAAITKAAGGAPCQ